MIDLTKVKPGTRLVFNKDGWIGYDYARTGTVVTVRTVLHDNAAHNSGVILNEDKPDDDHPWDAIYFDIYHGNTTLNSGGNI